MARKESVQEEEQREIQEKQRYLYCCLRDEILSTLYKNGLRYAVIDGKRSKPVIYFTDEEKLYAHYPELKPDDTPKTLPMLIDFEIEINSRGDKKEEAVKELRETNRELMSLKSRKKDLNRKRRRLTDIIREIKD